MRLFDACIWGGFVIVVVQFADLVYGFLPVRLWWWLDGLWWGLTISAICELYRIRKEKQEEEDAAVGVDVDLKKCTGCKECEEACPEDAIVIFKVNGRVASLVIKDKCTLCESCVSVCPEEAITVTYPKPKKKE